VQTLTSLDFHFDNKTLLPTSGFAQAGRRNSNQQLYKLAISRRATYSADSSEQKLGLVFKTSSVAERTEF
jgi:hypothetical protein